MAARVQVACETATKTNLVMIFGEITTSAKVDYEKVVRDTCRDVGFTSDDVGLDCDKCKVGLVTRTPSLRSHPHAHGMQPRGLVIRRGQAPKLLLCRPLLWPHAWRTRVMEAVAAVAQGVAACCSACTTQHRTTCAATKDWRAAVLAACMCITHAHCLIPRAIEHAPHELTRSMKGPAALSAALEKTRA